MTLAASHPDVLRLRGGHPAGRRAEPASLTPSQTACSHCRLPVPTGLVREGDGPQFCCHGCETSFSVIQSCGLGAYYRLLERSDAEPVAAKVTKRAYAEFDDPTFHSLYCRPLPGGLLHIDLLLEGVHCGACVWLLEKLPLVVPGVAEARVDLRRAAVAVTFSPAQVRLSRVGRALDSLGYPAHPARGPAAREARRAEDRRMLVRTAVAGACAGNIMLLFFALYAGLFEGMEHAHEQLFRWVAMALNTLCLAWPGLVFARSALAAIRTRTIHLDVPIALGLYLGGAWGIWKTIAGSGDIYFDSISALVFFLLVGRYIQQRQQRSAADAVELLFSVSPTVARRVGDDGSVSDVPTEALVPGDIVEIRPGDSAPGDGRIVSGESRLDLSVLTGESRPVPARDGDPIAAGSVNLSSVLRARVECTGESTRIGRLMRMVEEASQRRAAIVRLADRWGRWLLWALLALAALTLALWWHAGATVAIDHAAALLIATCPCGLGLATPMAMSIAIGRAARRGILVKGGDALQSLSAPGPRATIVLDKTGTVTFGRLSLVAWHGDDAARPLVGALEAHSSHPAAIALHRDLADDATADLPVEQSVQHTGAGIEGLVAGTHVAVGTRALLSSLGCTFDPVLDNRAEEVIRRGDSPVLIALDRRCVALAALGDPIRPDATACIRELRALGWRVEMLSGDHPDITASVGRSIGLDPADCRGGTTPEAKLAAIRELSTRGPVVMVGDGVNDAAALAAATVGVAVRGGAEASLTAADVSLSREGLSPLVELFHGARQTMRTIHWTIAASLVYNALAASLAIAGLISPLLAAFIMPASSLTVVAICLRGGAFRTRKEGAS
ncbi:MAG TPA: heavy metal translocating P-type ATPase [Phycisphaerales bacterium]|nr:heavy metal translocating P-type ATPase [Phycisphaerales bacterium]